MHRDGAALKRAVPLRRTAARLLAAGDDHRTTAKTGHAADPLPVPKIIAAADIVTPQSGRYGRCRYATL
ncbi:hypothetical protein [Sphingomonas sp. RIT328]|uniref:hypothetical protein n=1 Tax=Sphingomonas sp. RIT328 TaxID=1470591 RepID=UPI0004459EDC|nr:hypothetical protein [Sphingomonas sp. RIT328]EZP56762.1 hypothetical protein BW41_00603 [Sphingomonas sp. RIT328]